MGTKGMRKTAQISCAKSSVVLNKFSNIVTHGHKLTIKQDDTFRLLLENANELLLDIGYCAVLQKHKRLQHIL